MTSYRIDSIVTSVISANDKEEAKTKFRKNIKMDTKITFMFVDEIATIKEVNN